MKYINIHTHKVSEKQLLLEIVQQELTNLDSSILNYSIGIHPLHILESSLETYLEKIDAKLALPNCIALGECGLDKRSKTPLDIQILVLEKQLMLAQKHQKPVLIHCVLAFQELLVLKKKLKLDVPFIIHGFCKSMQLAHQLLDAGCYLSFGKHLIHNPKLQDTFKSIPMERIFLETDTTDLEIEEIYFEAARIKNISMLTLIDVVASNTDYVFNIVQ